MHKIGSVTLLGFLVALPITSDAVDLNGRWLVDGGVPVIVTITQTGSSLSIPYNVPFTGTIGATDPNGFTNYSVSWTDGTNFASFAGRVLPSGDLFDGQGGAYFPPNLPSVGGLLGTRCSCFDNNSANGDGCDVQCQVEPCWTCAGDPSVCAPTPDGGACDDGNACTSGETCSLGVCGGGAPVMPCFNMGGPWTDHFLVPDLANETHMMITVIQRGSDLRVGSYVGSIDPTTGAFDIRQPNLNLFCGSFDPLIGSLAADGMTYSATGYVEVPEPCCPDQCIAFPATDLGDHCGDGNLDPSEQCDDANLTGGDGCSALCTVEQCFACTGSPSVCAPTPGAACVDQNVCTVNETCAADGSCSGPQLDCGQCATCISVGCVATPEPVCKASTEPETSALSFKHNGNEKMDRFNWRWKKGADTNPSELGDPTNDQDLTVCVYDETYVTPSLLFSAAIPAGSLWSQTTTGFRYKDSSASDDGVLLATVDSGVGGKARVKVKGKGIHLADRPYGTPAAPLPLPLRVQLRGSNGFCVETQHDGTSVIKNDPASGIFKARGGP